MSEIKNKEDDSEPNTNNFSDECIFGSCTSCDGINHFDGWELVCECPCHIHKTEFQGVDNVPTHPIANQDKKEEIPIPLKAICLKESRTETDLISLYAKINEIGNLVLEGQDIGETPQKYWGRDEYEYWLTVSNANQ